MQTAESPDSSTAPREPERDPHASVIAFLVAASILGAAIAIKGGVLVVNKVLFDVAVALGLAAVMLTGVLAAILERRRPAAIEKAPDAAATADSDSASAHADLAAADASPGQPSLLPSPKPLTWPEVRELLVQLFRKYSQPRVLSIAAASGAALAIVAVLWRTDYVITPVRLAQEIGLAMSVAGGVVAALAARYFTNLDSDAFPEARGLAPAARVMAWLFVISAASIGAGWFGQHTVVRVLHFIVAAIVIAVSYALFRAGRALDERATVFPVALAPLSALGSRPNIFAGILDAGERQMGIDLRSTWALTVVRRTLEPLAICLVLLAWLVTGFTVVGPEEVGLVERSGVPLRGDPLSPGLHLHLPWPMDKVFRIPVRRVQSIEIGHGGVEAPGPENVLWAVAHAPNEFSLLLGNGRDLITVDAAVHYRIVDPRAWRYNCQNPPDALSALAYRAVMRNTVNRTLAEALSENVATLTDDMRATVQRGADSLGLGVAIIGFTVGGMHPPVEVAAAYQAVIAAEIRKVTAVVSANAYRNQIVPAAEATALVGSNMARADGADALARAAGEAWSFRTLETQYRSAPEDYVFRRRLETLESVLAGRPFTVVDARFMRDGGELWMIP
jgi:membrane protease subunit HflK